MRHWVLSALALGVACCIGIYMFECSQTPFRGLVASEAEHAEKPAVAATNSNPLAVASIVARDQFVAPKIHDSFERSADVWQLANDLLASGSTRDLLAARSAIQSCDAVLRSNEQLGNFVGGGQSEIKGPLRAERQLAVFELIRRCNGFSRAGVNAATALMDEVSARLRKQGWHTEGDDLSESGIQTSLASDFGPEIREALQMILPYWAAKNALTGDEPEFSEFRLALTLAACDLGNECSSQGLTSLTACAYDDRCEGLVMSEAQGRLQGSGLAMRYRDEIVRSVRQRDYSYFGLAGL